MEQGALCSWWRGRGWGVERARTCTVWESTFIPRCIEIALFRCCPPSLPRSPSLAAPRSQKSRETVIFVKKVTPNRLSYLGASSLRQPRRCRGVSPRAVLAWCTPSDWASGDASSLWRSLASFAILLRRSKYSGGLSFLFFFSHLEIK